MQSVFINLCHSVYLDNKYGISLSWRTLTRNRLAKRKESRTDAYNMAIRYISEGWGWTTHFLYTQSCRSVLLRNCESLQDDTDTRWRRCQVEHGAETVELWSEGVFVVFIFRTARTKPKSFYKRRGLSKLYKCKWGKVFFDYRMWISKNYVSN